MHEDILTRGALDEPVSFRPVEPLDCSFLSHRKTPFPLVAMNLFRPPTGKSRIRLRLLRGPANLVASCLRGRSATKKKRLLSSQPRWLGAVGTFGARQLVRFCHHNSTSTYLLVSPPDGRYGYEQKIISSIKTIRKKN